MNTIAEKEQKIIDEFEMLGGDIEMAVDYLMELGEQLPMIDEEKKTDEHIVKGCQSKVWLNATIKEGKVFYTADSNTAIVKGLACLLVRVLSGETPEAILKSEVGFPTKIGMGRFIGTQRSNGFVAMSKQMKLYALALSTKN